MRTTPRTTPRRRGRARSSRGRASSRDAAFAAGDEDGDGAAARAEGAAAAAAAAAAAPSALAAAPSPSSSPAAKAASREDARPREDRALPRRRGVVLGVVLIPLPLRRLEPRQLRGEPSYKLRRALLLDHLREGLPYFSHALLLGRDQDRGVLGEHGVAFCFEDFFQLIGDSLLQIRARGVVEVAREREVVRLLRHYRSERESVGAILPRSALSLRARSLRRGDEYVAAACRYGFSCLLEECSP